MKNVIMAAYLAFAALWNWNGRGGSSALNDGRPLNEHDRPSVHDLP